jgi:hypothetical protein
VHWGVSFVATLLVGRFQGVGPFHFLKPIPLASIGFTEGFLLVSLLGLCFWQASKLEVIWQWNLLAGGVHAILAVVNLTHWSFYSDVGGEVMGAVATAVHFVMIGVEGTMARRAWTATSRSADRS